MKLSILALAAFLSSSASATDINCSVNGQNHDGKSFSSSLELPYRNGGIVPVGNFSFRVAATSGNLGGAFEPASLVQLEIIDSKTGQSSKASNYNGSTVVNQEVTLSTGASGSAYASLYCFIK